MDVAFLFHLASLIQGRYSDLIKSERCVAGGGLGVMYFVARFDHA